MTQPSARPMLPALIALLCCPACWPGPPALGVPANGCPADATALAMLRAHAATYGTFAEVSARLPRTFEGTLTGQGRTGSARLTMDRDLLRLDMWRGGTNPERTWRAFTSFGIDQAGPWEISLSGMLTRVSGEDAQDAEMLAFVFRRQYLAPGMSPREVACNDASGSMLMWMTFADARGGVYRLGFEPGTARLREVALDRRGSAPVCRTADGSTQGNTFSFSFSCALPDHEPAHIFSWSQRSTDVPSFPEEWSGTGPTGERVRLGSSVAGVSCAEGSCMNAAKPPVDVTWPEGGVVKVPMLFYSNQIFVRAEVDGRRAWAVLDSGAGMVVIDSEKPLGRALAPAFSETGAGSTQMFDYGVAERSWVSMGGLSLRHVPVAATPLSVMDAYAMTRPEAIVGLPFFHAGAVRIDYGEGELTFAKDAALLPKDGVTLPMRLSRERLVVDANVNGAMDVFQLDTGDGNVISPEESWVRAHPELSLQAQPTIESRSGVGADATVTAAVPLKRITLGPIEVVGASGAVALGAPPAVGIAGRIGNGLLSRCKAVTFDVARRTLMLTPPCEEPAKKTDPADTGAVGIDHIEDWEDAPWVFTRITAGSGMDRAGVKAGDRIVQINGEPATLSLGRLKRGLDVPVGAHVTLLVLRDGQRLTFTATRRATTP